MEKRSHLTIWALSLAILLLAARVGAAGVNDEAYLIGGGDVLEVTVWKNAELSRIVTVRPDGMITLPLVGDLQAGGVTPMALGKAITQSMGEFVNVPNITVTVRESKSYQVYTQGAVTENGAFFLSRPMTVVQLFSIAGGQDEGADLARAFILRRNVRIPANLVPDPEVAEITQEIVIKPGDVLMVPYKRREERVLVVGQVNTPLVLDYREGMTVLDAYAEAGGGTEFAKLKSVKVIRESSEGKELINVNLEKVMERGELELNVLLVPGDIVSVP